MLYQTMGKNKSFHKPGVRKQGQVETHHQRNPGSEKSHTRSGISFEAYSALAQTAMEQGDRVLAETYYQYAEHALRTRGETRENLPAPEVVALGYKIRSPKQKTLSPCLKMNS